MSHSPIESPCMTGKADTNLRTGLLLVNLGTPDAPTTEAVRAYLQEFLSDPRVIDIPAPLRHLLLRFVILPRRAPASAELYRSIWTEQGSPLLVHSLALLREVAARLPGVPVEFAMRYGKPTMHSGLDALVKAGCEKIVVFPLYPQHADSSTGSTIHRVREIAAKLKAPPRLEFVPAFYDEPGFIDAFARIARPILYAGDEVRPQHLLLSFHGLPERHMKKGDATRAHCLVKADCCDRIVAANRDCYRAQCFATARAIVRKLRLDEQQNRAGAAGIEWSIGFQSRLGRTPWIKPYSDLMLHDLAARGIKRVAVMCPAFVADCLETVEEIGIRAARDFRSRGGELRLVPSLNSDAGWADTVVGLARRAGLA